MKNPLISVIVPVYGVEKYIEKCARSLFSQNYGNVEFIFVNDGTKDRSIEILNALIDKEFAALRSKILIVDKENGGLPSARKTGLEHATGDYILHVDSDDCLAAGALAKIAGAAEATDADLIHFDFLKEYPEKIKHKRERSYRSGKGAKFALDLVNGRAFGYVWNKCFKRSIYTSHELYFAPHAMNEDTYMCLQLLPRAASIYHIKEPLYHYNRSNVVSYTATCDKGGRRQFCMNMLDLYRRYSADIESSPLKTTLNAIMMRVAYYCWKNKWEFLADNKEIAAIVAKAPVGFDYYIPILLQLHIRFIAERLCR